jgi:hypothetical protein
VRKISLKRKRPDDETEAATADAAIVPKATLTLKTYDPVSGTVLKYKTDKAAEVGRLIASLGTLGRSMAALPEVAEGRFTIIAVGTEVGLIGLFGRRYCSVRCSR